MDRKGCEASIEARERAICAAVGPAPAIGTRAFSYPNDCGGRSIGYVLGVDAYTEVDHYNASGELVGVAVHPLTGPCSGVRDVYGMNCELEPSTPIDCSLIDTDAGA